MEYFGLVSSDFFHVSCSLLSTCEHKAHLYAVLKVLLSSERVFTHTRVTAIPCATVDITTDGVDDTTAVTAIVLAVQEGVEQLLLLLLLTKED